MPVKCISVLLLLLQLSCCFSSGSCGKVLVWPMEFSHWMNMKTILDALVQQGHEVTVLRSSASIVIGSNNESGIKFETFHTSYRKDEIENFFMDWFYKMIYNVSIESYWETFSLTKMVILKYSDICEDICKEVILNKKLMTKLQESRFDVVLADPVSPGGELLAELLKIPLVYSLRGFVGYMLQKHGGGLLLPPSYVPVMMSGLGSQMTFMERVQNLLCVLYFDFWFPKFNEKRWDQFYSEVLGRPVTFLELMGKADMWLIRSYWDLEFPRPLLPNFDFIGGLHCKPAKPLPQEMEDFVQSSGEEGVVVFSLGSMISNLTEERANVIASALAQLPQKVLWRFEGKKPDMLGSNTRLYKWIPQNDLLGHPKTKAFITHGGANGVFEAIYHGIPMVGLPLFGDQLDNIVYMKAKGAAVKLNLKTMSSADLLNALKTVINDPSYKENAMTLSRIHHDQPMKPLDRAVFWIEYVMRHKGAKHLRVAAHDLTWYQYHSLDVIGFLLACVAITTYLIVKCCLLVYRYVLGAGKKKKRD
ncbi:UDP-glucuronosyltransferase 2B13 precursor [Oryctolagus cuniculus]|uniref:UDP-glucuronosyltransferase 2B13 n=1 Tax=Oryctolagus cuniculus TaxID=9986 RepID=UDB13_RABIT|nr:UDP-glucuronosyltransferase 2B13 precursor [Oryctolagus cuniculus]P36512.1 RecName: Full=UDP-glucuronosyltransferase 2B13; Short=UDPGT 2B13; AltName: Full=EGT10; Flags: Precursor [Oryctolagus cuniculus]AAA18020.1 UDP-glucuronosyltransferase [Oryctolagus cuniculus]